MAVLKRASESADTQSIMEDKAQTREAVRELCEAGMEFEGLVHPFQRDNIHLSAFCTQ
jgi:hypothetical protein